MLNVATFIMVLTTIDRKYSVTEVMYLIEIAYLPIHILYRHGKSI